VTGQKTESEKFAGALRTYSCEALMQDGKALQAGTSHNLGQNFAKAFELKFQSEAGTIEHAWNTSWGVSTRMVGGLVMTHSDDNGVVIPPLLAPVELVIVPIWRKETDRAEVLEAAERVRRTLFDWERREPARLRVHVDTREGITPGAKYYHWETRGVPIRMELGPRDIAANQAVLVRRDTKTKQTISLDTVGEDVEEMLERMQVDLLSTARDRLDRNSHRGDISYDRFKEIMDSPEGGFVYAGWNGDPAVEARVKEETKATIRCIPDAEFQSADRPTRCMVTGEPAKHEVVWARAY
jgi:prolyl-tRNA synthetase